MKCQRKLRALRSPVESTDHCRHWQESTMGTTTSCHQPQSNLICTVNETMTGYSTWFQGGHVYCVFLTFQRNWYNADFFSKIPKMNALFLTTFGSVIKIECIHPTRPIQNPNIYFGHQPKLQPELQNHGWEDFYVIVSCSGWTKNQPFC